jgi:hypothetical protein
LKPPHNKKLPKPKARRSRTRRARHNRTICQSMTKAESLQARAIAFEAALAVIG